MNTNCRFDYFYGNEAAQFSFYRIPKLLIQDNRFKELSNDAKLLYGLILDRMSLSMKNGWLDSRNRAYIHYTTESVIEDLGCSKATTVKIMAALDSTKGIGLIERIKQGLGKPDIIYVKNFVTKFMNEEEVAYSSPYFYGEEAEQFTFYRIPKLLIKDSRFKELSNDAKLLYGLLLDRMSLSLKNGWLDSLNRAYVHYTTENIMEDLNCSKATCVKIMAELDSAKGIGLIERIKQGLGKPDIIYVKNFVTTYLKEDESDPEHKDNNQSTSTNPDDNSQWSNNYTSRGLKIKPQGVQKLNHQKSKKYTSDGLETIHPAVQKMEPNYTNTINTEGAKSNLIYLPEREGNGEESSAKEKIDEMDTDITSAYIELIKENICFDEMYTEKDPLSRRRREIFEELYEIICEVVCVKHKTIRIGGLDYPYELVKAKFLKLNEQHLEYVVGCLETTTSKIGNIKNYMITSLYNAPTTFKTYMQQLVNHDMFGQG